MHLTVVSSFLLGFLGHTCAQSGLLLDTGLAGLAGMQSMTTTTTTAPATKPWFCHKLECPRFTNVSSNGNFELRSYEPSVWVATNASATSYEQARSTGLFSKLFNYISGNNNDHMKIAMTAPVVNERQTGAGINGTNLYIMHFMVPFSLQINPPVPTDATVYIVRAPAMDVYVKQFGGFDNAAQDAAMLTQLKADVTAAGGHYMDNVWLTAGYDGPYTFSNRHNEVWLVKQ